MDDVLQLHDVIVLLQFLQHSNLSDRRAWDAIVAVVDLDLFDGHDVARRKLLSLEDNSVSTLTEFWDVSELLFEFFWRHNGLILTSATGPAVSDWDDVHFLRFFVNGDQLVVIVLIGNGGLGGLDRQLALDHGDVFSFVVHDY